MSLYRWLHLTSSGRDVRLLMSCTQDCGDDPSRVPARKHLSPSSAAGCIGTLSGSSSDAILDACVRKGERQNFDIRSRQEDPGAPTRTAVPQPICLLHNIAYLDTARDMKQKCMMLTVLRQNTSDCGIDVICVSYRGGLVLARMLMRRDRPLAGGPLSCPDKDEGMPVPRFGDCGRDFSRTLGEAAFAGDKMLETAVSDHVLRIPVFSPVAKAFCFLSASPKSRRISLAIFLTSKDGSDSASLLIVDSKFGCLAIRIGSTAASAKVLTKRNRLRRTTAFAWVDTRSIMRRNSNDCVDSLMHKFGESRRIWKGVSATLPRDSLWPHLQQRFKDILETGRLGAGEHPLYRFN